MSFEGLALNAASAAAAAGELFVRLLLPLPRLPVLLLQNSLTHEKNNTWRDEEKTAV